MLSLGPMSMLPSGPPRSYRALLSCCLLVAINVACSRTDAEQLPEWTPADHDNQTQPQPNQVDIENPSPGMPSGEALGLNDVVLATWKQNCVPCHGIIGRGDGPQAATTRPRDLTDPTWQRVAIDSEIIHTIKKGRGRMPAFGQIPDETVQGLVRLIRMLNASPPPDSATPTPSASAQAGAPAAPSPTSSAGAALPSNHPPIGTDGPHGMLPSNHPPVGAVAPGASLPANHPPVGASSAPNAAPR